MKEVKKVPCMMYSALSEVVRKKEEEGKKTSAERRLLID
jgi:hypothetical protein